MRLLLLPPVVVFLTVGVMILLNAEAPLMQIVAPPFNWAGLLPLAVGIGIANWHARLFRRLGTNINTFGEPGTLTMDGLFRRTRNPMYLGMFVFLIGVACALGSLSVFVGPLGFFVLADRYYIPIEEKAMALKFGDAYAVYQRAVRRWV